MRTAALLLFFLIFPLFMQAQILPQQGGVSGPVEPAVPADSRLFSDTGDAAIARRYVEWARKEAAAGRSAEALAGLERGADYAVVSSDISCLLAVLRSEAGRSRFSVLEACRLALETMRWEQYGPEDARLLEAKTLTELRRFEEALTVLDRCDPERYAVQYSRLKALRALALLRSGAETVFAGTAAAVMDRFPRETGPVRLLFEYAARGRPKESLRPLVDLALRRLPLLIDSDPELAYMAVPFLRDREAARRYTASYRAVRKPNPASLPAALELGLINGKQAVEELFDIASGSGAVRAQTLDRDLIVNVNTLLESEDDRTYLKRNLLQFSGVITEDGDHDGVIDAWTSYHDGMLTEYRYDADQNGEANLTIAFARGLPVQAEIILALDEYSAYASPLAGNGISAGASRVTPDSARKALLRWERYPAVLDTELGGKRYIPRPLDYFFTPIRFTPLVFGGPDYPNRELFLNEGLLKEGVLPVLTERSLLSFSCILEQPSVEFPGCTERVELSGGIPVKSIVYLKDRKVSETEFIQGRPFIQRLDLDTDGRMETIRRFDKDGLVSSESDWDNDGVYEYAEIRQGDGSMKKFWDFNKDGIREAEHE